MYDDVVTLEIRGKKYSVYYKEGNFFTNMPCPIHGNMGGERMKKGISEIVCIETEKGVFQVERDADLFLLREIFLKANELVGRDEIVCEKCMQKLLAM